MAFLDSCRMVSTVYLLYTSQTHSLKLKAWLWEIVLHVTPRHEKGRMGGTPHVENSMMVPRGSSTELSSNSVFQSWVSTTEQLPTLMIRSICHNRGSTGASRVFTGGRVGKQSVVSTLKGENAITHMKPDGISKGNEGGRKKHLMIPSR